MGVYALMNIEPIICSIDVTVVTYTPEQCLEVLG